ncbi:hypothetical protein M2387_001495 [Klebsiella sp. BIGb0407]|nr:hypothetical protein [Klebsiella sp. BIGb0407]
MAEVNTKKKGERAENVEIVIKKEFYRNSRSSRPGMNVVELAESHGVSVFIDVFERNSKRINV